MARNKIDQAKRDEKKQEEEKKKEEYSNNNMMKVAMKQEAKNTGKNRRKAREDLNKLRQMNSPAAQRKNYKDAKIIGKFNAMQQQIKNGQQQQKQGNQNGNNANAANPAAAAAQMANQAAAAKMAMNA